MSRLDEIEARLEVRGDHIEWWSQLNAHARTDLAYLLAVARAAEEVVRLNEADRDIDAFWGAVGALGRALEAK